MHDDHPDNVSVDDEGRPRVRARSGTVSATPYAVPKLPPLANLDIAQVPEIANITAEDKVYHEIGGCPDLAYPFSWELFCMVRAAIAKIAAGLAVPSSFLVGRYYNNVMEDDMQLTQLAMGLLSPGKMPDSRDVSEPNVETTFWERKEIVAVLKKWPLVQGEPNVVWR
jgi:hypothetical protein